MRWKISYFIPLKMDSMPVQDCLDNQSWFHQQESDGIRIIDAFVLDLSEDALVERSMNRTYSAWTARHTSSSMRLALWGAMLHGRGWFSPERRVYGPRSAASVSQFLQDIFWPRGAVIGPLGLNSSNMGRDIIAFLKYIICHSACPGFIPGNPGLSGWRI